MSIAPHPTAVAIDRSRSDEREAMEIDVLIVGAGPAGLAAAIRLAEQAQTKGQELAITVVEKGGEVGAHILSGAVMETRALDELLPDWQQRAAPLNTPVTKDEFWYLTSSGGMKIPRWAMPKAMHNDGNFIVSLGNVCRWLAKQAEALGVEIYPGFAAAEVLYDDTGAVKGVATGDMGIGKDGTRRGAFEPGMELHAKYTLFAEGVRGSLSKQVIAHFDLAKDAAPQTYGLGIKELWEIDPTKHRQGLAFHSFGWPLDGGTYGGGFCYHLEDNQISVGFVVGLDYKNPTLSPFEEMQRYKTHPRLRPFFKGGRRIAYGARAINEGGWQSIPKLIFPGGALIGCTAGFVNVPKIKGSHNAMKTGMLAADAVFDAIGAGRQRDEVTVYPEAFADSWVAKELKAVRNCRPSFHFGSLIGTMISGLELWTGGKLPYTLSHHRDHEATKPLRQVKPIMYPKPDGTVTFDRLSSVFLSNTNHEEDQPAHLRLIDPDTAISTNWQTFGSPEQYYCPAGVYELIDTDGGGKALQVSAQNCVHCKTCDIKDPTQNINWTTPQGGGGPAYPNM
jgi:electron-transferring-flavoprotein dehydrogenase